MRRHSLLAIVLCVGVFVARTAVAQVTEPAAELYSLAAPPSTFEWGCFGPCACPVLVQSPVAGTFVLTRSHADPLFTYYDVSDVRWTIQSPTGPVHISGSGTYRRGGEVALSEELVLDLSFGGLAAQHFDSGLRSPGAAFPEIKTNVSLHFEQACRDTVIQLDAKPSGVVSVPEARRGLSLAVGPNPAAGTSEASFTLPAASTVDLGVFDLAGRRVCALVSHEHLPSGSHTRSWNGRSDDGTALPPGIYLVRLETPGDRLTKVAVRVR